MGRCQVGPSVMAHGGRFGVGQQVSEHWHVLKWMRDMQLCLVRVSDEAGNYPRLVLSNLFSVALATSRHPGYVMATLLSIIDAECASLVATKQLEWTGKQLELANAGNFLVSAVYDYLN